MCSSIEKIYRERLLSKEPLLNDDDIQLNCILKYLPTNKEISILDAGCGNGNYAFYLSQLGYKNIHAVDLFSDIKTNNFIYQKSSIDRLLFKDKNFDFIYSNSVIYYLKNPEDGIKEFKRVLKDDGILFFTAHTKYSLFTLWRIFKRDILKLKSMEHLKEVKFYSASYYKNILEKNGFEIILQDGYEVSFFIYPLYKTIGKIISKIFNIKFPTIKTYISRGVLGKIKSEISYHSVFIARKVDA